MTSGRREGIAPLFDVEPRGAQDSRLRSYVLVCSPTPTDPAARPAPAAVWRAAEADGVRQPCVSP